MTNQLTELLKNARYELNYNVSIDNDSLGFLDCGGGQIMHTVKDYHTGNAVFSFDKTERFLTLFFDYDFEECSIIGLIEKRLNKDYFDTDIQGVEVKGNSLFVEFIAGGKK